MRPFSIYLHIPFCRHRCSYCDFNTYAGLENLVGEYTKALRAEISQAAAAAGARLPVHTIFFGGGTPSLLPEEELSGIMETLQKCFDIQPGAEVTLEANPGTLSRTYLGALHSMGINRLSLGMQSADAEELVFLERQHGLEDVSMAVEWARAAGFDNLSLDLIFGLPYQSDESWRKTLHTALSLQPDHLSLYALTLEHGTPLLSQVEKGLVPEPDPDTAADMYEYAAQLLDQSGFLQYEISNWGRDTGAGEPLACRHNLQYWRSLPYLGFGAGAHGFAAGIRTANVLSPAVYIQRCMNGKELIFPRSSAAAEVRELSRSDEMGEVMMMGLRLTREGVSDADFEERFQVSLNQVYAEEIELLVRRGLLEWSGEADRRLRLTQRGRLLGNQVFMEFI
jgi:oxygen-independent coproporphyrinogen III oxidase